MTVYGVALVVVAACYAASYSRYGRSGVAVENRPHAPRHIPFASSVRPPVWAGLGFIAATLARNRLNLMVLAGMVALGVGVVLDFLLASWTNHPSQLREQSRLVVYRAIAPSLTLVLVTLVGLRAAFLLPVKREANWVFRLIDPPAVRASLLASIEVSFVVAGVALPLLIGLPLQIAALGLHRSALQTPFILMMGLLMSEVVLWRWRRVPFTCSYIPGKSHLTVVILGTWLAYGVAVFVAAHLIAWTVLRPSRMTMVAGVLLAAYAWLRRRRVAASETMSFEFEDEMPDVIRTLRLSG